MEIMSRFDEIPEGRYRGPHGIRTIIRKTRQGWRTHLVAGGMIWKTHYSKTFEGAGAWAAEWHEKITETQRTGNPTHTAASQANWAIPLEPQPNES